MSKFDLIVIGAGPAGTAAVSSVAGAGKRIAIVEKHKPGGTCLNYGCDPTKTLIHTAKLLHQASNSARYGLTIPKVGYEWQKVRQHVSDVQNKMRGGSVEESYKQLEKRGIEVIKGSASFISPYAIKVGDKTYEAENFIIAVGNQSVIPPVEGLKQSGYITNKEAVSLPQLPRRLAIVGGGAIGIEFAQVFSRFGVEVTVLEAGSNILDTEDREVAAKLIELLQKEAIVLKTDARLEQVQESKEGKHLRVKVNDEDFEEITVDELLIAVGRKPALEGLELEAAGVKYGDKGIEVSLNLRTSAPHIWAAGDIVGSYAFTHIAEAQGKLCAANVFSSLPTNFDEHAIGWVTFTDPELAHLGKTEEALKESKINYRALYQPLKDIPRALTKGETEGLVKLLVDNDDKLLGAHILGSEASELIAPLVFIMQNNLQLASLKGVIFPYPTFAESLKEIAN